MKVSHKAGYLLSIAAFLLFLANEFSVLAGWGAIDFTGVFGAAVLMSFLGIGLIVQIWKFEQGSHNKTEAAITFIMLPLHIAAALTIWFRTQISHAGLPTELPLYLVGLYWLIGALEIVARRIGRELQLFRRDYKSPEQLVAELRQEITVLRLEKEQALKDANKASQQATRLLEDANRVFEVSCEGCGKVFTKPTQAQAVAARDGHRRVCKGAPMLASGNGHNQDAIPEIVGRGG